MDRAKNAVGSTGNQGYQRAQTDVGRNFAKVPPAGFKAGAHLDTGIPMLLLGCGQWTI